MQPDWLFAVQLLQQEPVPGIQAHPNPTNLLVRSRNCQVHATNMRPLIFNVGLVAQEWHYTIDGPKDSPYEGGLYHGKLTFPSQYPYKVGPLPRTRSCCPPGFSCYLST